MNVEKLVNFFHQKQEFGTDWIYLESGEDRIELENGKGAKFALVATTPYTFTFIRLKGLFEQKLDTAIFQTVYEFFQKESIHIFLVHGDCLFRDDMKNVRLAKFQALKPTTKHAEKILNLLRELYECNLQLLDTITIGNQHRNSYELACYFEEQMIVVFVNGTKGSSQFPMIYRTLSSDEEACSFRQEVQKELDIIRKSEEKIMSLINGTDDEAEYNKESNTVTVFNSSVSLLFEKKYQYGEGIVYWLPAFNKQYEGFESFSGWETATSYLMQTITDYLKKNRLYYITGAKEDNYFF